MWQLHHRLFLLFCKPSLSCIASPCVSGKNPNNKNMNLSVQGGGRWGCRGAAAPPDFRNLCSKSPNHVVYSPTIPLPPQSWRPPWLNWGVICGLMVIIPAEAAFALVIVRLRWRDEATPPWPGRPKVERGITWNMSQNDVQQSVDLAHSCHKSNKIQCPLGLSNSFRRHDRGR